MFCFSVLFPSSVAIDLMGKRELVSLLLLPFWCLMTVSVLWLFLLVSWVGLQSVIVVFPDHTHLFFLTKGNTVLLENDQVSTGVY